MSNTKKTIAVDFDGTLADDSRVKYPDCGPPIWPMVNRVKAWIADGHEVVLFTARLAEHSIHRERDQVKRLTEWLDLYDIRNADGTLIAMTAWKLPKFDEFWDDRAVRVYRNTGHTKEELDTYYESTPATEPAETSQLPLPFDWDAGLCGGPSGHQSGIRPVGQDPKSGYLPPYPYFLSLCDLLDLDPREPYTR